MKFPSEKPNRLNMQALLRDHGRDQCAQVLSTSDRRERKDQPFVAAVTNNFSIRMGKRMMIEREMCRLDFAASIADVASFVTW